MRCRLTARPWSKAGLVTVLVLAGFLAGFSPPLVAAVGAAIMLITRTRDPHLVYEEVDWGLLVFFVRLFLIVGATENAGLTERLLSFGERFKLQHLAVRGGNRLFRMTEPISKIAVVPLELES
jgi:Na+/H+ antiporter NhaD/arsenite permease-like protein